MVDLHRALIQATAQCSEGRLRQNLEKIPQDGPIAEVFAEVDDFEISMPHPLIHVRGQQSLVPVRLLLRVQFML